MNQKEFPLEHTSEQISPVLDRAEVYKIGRKKHRIDYLIKKQVIVELQAVEYLRGHRGEVR